jgi:erythromycin esterase
MVVFGFAFSHGGFQAVEMPFPSRRGLTAFHVTPLNDSTLDGTLARAGFAAAVFDLRTIPASGPVAEWFAEPHQTRSIGAGYADAFAANFVYPTLVRARYDALIFVDSTARARPNPGGVREPAEPLAAAGNLDFEDLGADGRPASWRFSNDQLRAFGYAVTVSEDRPASGRRCAEVRRDPGPHYGETYGGLSQLIDATPYRGRRVRIKAMARADVVGGGEARLWIQASRPQVALMQPPDARPSTAVVTAAWQPYDVVVDVPANATTLRFGFALVGDGRAWVDGVSLEVVP